VAKLRLKKLEEIRELLSISPKADVDEVLRILKWWRETGKVSIPKKQKTRRIACSANFTALTRRV